MIKFKTEFLNGRKFDTFNETSGQVSLLHALKQQSVDIVVDVRFSAYQPDYFRPDHLAYFLPSQGVLYLNLGDQRYLGSARNTNLGNPSLFRGYRGDGLIALIGSDYKLEQKKAKIEEILLALERKHFIFHQFEGLKRFNGKSADVIARELYKDFITMNHLQCLRKLLSFLKERSFQNPCLICYCPTTDELKCHRFWLKQMLEEIDKNENC